MSTMSDVQALIFDVFGTVVDWRTGVAQQARPFLTTHGIDIDPGHFADLWRAEYQPSMGRIRSASRPFVPLDVLHRENLDRVLTNVGYTPEKIPAHERDHLNLAWHRLDPWPDVLAGLHRLKEHFIIAPMSNANIRLSIDIAKRAGLPWDAILGAEVVQAYKPTPQSYVRTVEILGLLPHQVAMVAAHNDDLAAVRRCGLRTIFIPRPTEHGPQQHTDLHPEQDWDVIAEDFIHLAQLL